MKDFLKYFLGAGTEIEFTNFSFAHFAPILVMIGVIFLIYRYREKLIRYALAFLLILSEMSYYWRLVAVPSLGPNPVDHLPITVCGWVVVFASYMLLGKSQTLFDICYFWLLSGSLFALATPTPLTYTGPTRYRYYQFWVEHTLGYVAIFYMIFVHGMRPNRRSFVRSYSVLLGLSAFAAWVNSMIPGANYLYMARPEAAPSVLDILPANFALRTGIIVAVITAMYALAYWPWARMDKRRKMEKA